MRQLIRAACRLTPFKEPIFTVLRELPMPRPLTRNLRFTGTMDVRIDDRHSFLMMNHASYIETDLFWHGFGNGWEATSLRLWCRLARQARCILDVGANTGVYSLAAKCLNPAATVVAFEPVRRVFDKLNENIRLNGYAIKAERGAVSDASGSALLYDIPEEDVIDIASLEPVSAEGDADVVTYPVPITTLDDYRSTLDTPVDLIKIDVERHEAGVLRGFRQGMAERRPTILLEVLDDEVSDELVPMLSELGYAFYAVIEGCGICKSRDLRGGYDGLHRNFLICRPDMFDAAGLGEFLCDQPGAPAPPESRR